LVLEHVEIEFRSRAGSAQVEFLQLRTADLTEESEPPIPENQLRGPSGSEHGSRGGSNLQTFERVEAIEQGLDDPLEPEEIAPAHQSQPRRLVRERLPGPWQVNVGDLEQLGVGRAVGLIVTPRHQEAGNQAASDRILFLAAGVFDPDRKAAFLRIEG